MLNGLAVRPEGAIPSYTDSVLLVVEGRCEVGGKRSYDRSGLQLRICWALGQGSHANSSCGFARRYGGVLEPAGQCERG
jgi:hypothetical protein